MRHVAHIVDATARRVRLSPRAPVPVSGASRPGRAVIGLEAELPLRHLNRDLEEAVEGIRGVLPLAGILE